MNIVSSDMNDWNKIMELYGKAIEFQKSKFSKHWHSFDKDVLAREIIEKRHWKILDQEEIACIFSVTFQDITLWDERDLEPSIYLHRIVTNPAFMGRGYVRAIVEWAKTFAKGNDKKYIRLDTFGDNKRLNEYYAGLGFEYVGKKKFIESDPVPPHYLEGELSLFEMRI